MHLWSFILWSCLGAFEQMVTGLLRNVVAKVRDPAVADKVTMMGWKRRLPIQLHYAIALTSRRKVSLEVRRVFSFGFEAWKGNSRAESLSPGFRRDSEDGCSTPHCRQREQTVRRGKFNSNQVTDRQKTSSDCRDCEIPQGRGNWFVSRAGQV